jgi:hypothetical protein
MIETPSHEGTIHRDQHGILGIIASQLFEITR